MIKSFWIGASEIRWYGPKRYDQDRSRFGFCISRASPSLRDLLLLLLPQPEKKEIVEEIGGIGDGKEEV